MILFQKKYTLTPQDSKADIKFEFECPGNVEQLLIHMQYSPDKEEDYSVCMPKIKAAIERYYDEYSPDLQPMQAEKFIPIKNLLTLSLDHEGEYIGNAHRWDNDQHHRITQDYADRGFVPPKKLSGLWSGMLHMHEVISPKCECTITVEGSEK